MVKVEVIEQFTLKEFKKIKDIKRAIKEHEDTKYDGKLYPRDTFKCDEEMAKYLTGANPLRKIVVKVIEVEPKEQWIVQEEKDNKVHVRPVVDGEIIDTPVEEIIKPKKKKSSKK